MSLFIAVQSGAFKREGFLDHLYGLSETDA